MLPLLLTLSIISTCRADNLKDNPFGVLTFLPWNHSWNNYMYKNNQALDRAIDLLKELGISIIRVDFSWNYIEKEKDKFDFQRYDYIVNKCAKNNIEILAILGYSAPWTGAKWNNPPNDEKAFLNYVKTTVKHYKNLIRYWEFWNEPDSNIYWYPQDDMKTYTLLLKKVYSLIKSTNPDNIVLLGGLTGDGFYAFKNILSNGGGDYFDIVNFHPFFDPFRKDGLDEIRFKLKHIHNELKKYSLNKKIWLTEIGCPGSRSSDNCSWWLGRCPDEDQQAEFLKKSYEFLLSQEGVEKIFWAFFQDTDNHFKNGVDDFGLVRKDFSKKPAYCKYKKIIGNAILNPQ